MKYNVKGTVDKKSFEIEVDAKSENHAKELAYAHFGSKSGAKRLKIAILEVKKNE